MILFTVASLSLTLACPATLTTSSPYAPPSAPPSGLPVRADSTSPLLSVEALTQMTAFWTSFMKEPPAIRDTAQTHHLKAFAPDLPEVKQTAGFYFERVDMEALAAQYPSVAEDFKRAGLTPHEWTSLRLALYTALMLQLGEGWGIKMPIAPTDIRWKNLTFLRAHPKELGALKATGMWLPE